MRQLAIALLLTTLASGLLASTPDTGAQPWDPIADGPQASSLTVTHKCVVKLVDAEKRELVVFDEATESLQRLRIAKDLSVRAESKKQFDGRRKLAFEDFVVGQRLKVTVMVKDGAISRIKVLKS